MRRNRQPMLRRLLADARRLLDGTGLIALHGLHARIDALEEHVGWLAQTVHQAHHGPAETIYSCRKVVCRASVELLRRGVRH